MGSNPGYLLKSFLLCRNFEVICHKILSHILGTTQECESQKILALTITENLSSQIIKKHCVVPSIFSQSPNRPKLKCLSALFLFTNTLLSPLRSARRISRFKRPVSAFKVHILILRRLQNFAKAPPYICLNVLYS